MSGTDDPTQTYWSRRNAEQRKPDWADDKAREWLAGHFEGRGWDDVDAASLAALLREVRDPDLSRLHDEAVQMGFDAALAGEEKL